MTNSHDDKSRKCLSGILRRLLCTRSLPTHPSDQFIESSAKKVDQNQENKRKQVVVEVKVTTPGVVARLMGLDSFPNTPLPPRDRTLGAYFRSRSVNSIDFLSHFEPIKQRNHQHRRVRTSVSFREGIDDNYGFVLCGLEKVDETREFLIKKRACQQLEKKKGIRSERNEKLQEKNVNNNLRRKGVGNVVNQKKDFSAKTKKLKERRGIMKQVESKEALIGSSKCVKKKKNEILANNKVHSDQHGMKKGHHGKIPEVARVKCSRKPPPPQIVNSQHPHSSSGAHCDNGEVKAMTKSKSGRKMKNEESFYYKRMVGEIYNLTKTDVEEDWKLAQFEEMCQEFGQEILEVLLKQFVDELVLLYRKRKLCQV